MPNGGDPGLSLCRSTARRWASSFLVLLVLGTACSGGGAKKQGQPQGTASSKISTTTTQASHAWQTTGVQAASTIVGSGDTVASVDAAVSPDLQAVVIDAASGQVRFRRPWSPSRQFGGMGVGSPAVVGGVVVTMEASGSGTAIVAVDAHTGAERWRQVVPETFAPFVCGQLVCAEQGPDESAALVARDPATGATRWSSPGSQSSVVNDEGAFVEEHLGTPPLLYSLDPGTGGVRWRSDLSAAIGRGATTDNGWDAEVIDGVLIASVGEDPAKGMPGGAVGLDPATGVVKWKRPAMEICPLHTKTLAILCGSTSGLRRVEPATGRDMWIASQFAAPSKPGPFLGILANGSALVGNDQAGNPISINVSTGAVTPPTAGALTWMLNFKQINGQVTPGQQPDQFLGYPDAVPWDAARGTPAPSLDKVSDIPGFVGLTLKGLRIFADASGNVRALPS